MNTCIGFPSGVNTPTYTTQRGTSTTISTTITRNIISITLNQTDLFNFTDHTGTNRSVQIPPNALYSGTGLTTAINTLTSPFKVECVYSTVTPVSYTHLTLPTNREV